MPQADTAVNDEVVAATTAPESAPEEIQTDDGANAQVSDQDDENFFDEVDAQVAEGDKEAETVEVETPPVETTDRTQGEKELAPKSQNRFQTLANENRELKEKIERLKTQESQVATEQELLNEVNPETGDYYTPQEVERIAFQQSREQQSQSIAQQRYELEVQQNQETISGEAQKALADFPIFDENNAAEFDPQAARDADALLGENLLYIYNGNQYSANTLRKNGIDLGTQATLIGSNISPYQLYKTLADSANRAAAKAQTIGQAKAQKATEKMLANADVGPDTSQATKTKADPMMDAFDEEAANL